MCVESCNESGYMLVLVKVCECGVDKDEKV